MKSRMTVRPCLLFAILTLTLSISCGAMAAGSTEKVCPERRTWADYLARNLERTPEARFHFVDEPVKSALIARFNDVDPPTYFAPERVGYFGATAADGSAQSPRGPSTIVPAGQMAVLVFITEGCVDYAGPVPVAHLQEIISPPR